MRILPCQFRWRLAPMLIAALLSFALFADAATRIRVQRVIENRQAWEGKIVEVEGFVRFDRLSQRGFLYKNLADMRSRNYRKTVFLELGNENYTSMKIRDGTYVVVSGYLSNELRGPLGVYAGHIIVDKMWELSPKH